MSQFFLELFSEEMPTTLQKNARENMLKLFKESFSKSNIIYKSGISYSTPNRLVFLFEGLPIKIHEKALKIKGPRTDAPKQALEGFIKSNDLDKKNVTEENTDKGKFYFASTKAKTILVEERLAKLTPKIIGKFSWKKSMKWSNYDLNWGRPLKSILAIFDNKILKFKFFHLISNNLTFADSTMEDSVKIIKNYKSYLKLLKDKNIILDHNLRKKYIIKKINKISKSRAIIPEINEKLLNEVTDLVEKPKIIACKFNSNFLNMPKEILITSMQQHQKYFPTFDQKGKLLNIFLVITNCDDKKGFIKSGNERVIEARLSDANFFWEKNKSQNLVKQVVNLKEINFFTKLGSLFEKVQRIRKLGSLISDKLNYNKEKIEIAASICKVDLLSDLVGEYPELQGIMGSYFAKEQGFEEDIVLAIKEQYLPIGMNSKVPKKPTSAVIAIVDKIDTLVGFFGIDEIPTSSKDPFALRRSASGLLRIIIENNLKLELKDLINYSINLYEDQGFELSNQSVQNDLIIFMRERVKNYFKDKKIRLDIIEGAINSYKSDDFVSLFKKCKILNKSIDNDVGKHILASYKRASNILDQEIKKNKLNIKGMPDSVLFKKEEEKILFDEINEIRKYLSNNFKNENYEKTLEILANSKKNTDNFFDNVVVNDENQSIKANRLELIKMLCMTLDNFIDFSKVEGA